MVFTSQRSQPPAKVRPHTRPTLSQAIAACLFAGAVIVTGPYFVRPAGAEPTFTATYDGTPFTTAAIARGSSIYVPLAALASALRGSVASDGPHALNVRLGDGAPPDAVLSPLSALALDSRDFPAGYRSGGQAEPAFWFAGQDPSLARQLMSWGFLAAYQQTLIGPKALLPGSPAAVTERLASFASARGAALTLSLLLRRIAADPGPLSVVNTGYFGSPGQDGALYAGRLVIHGQAVQTYAALFRVNNVVCTLAQTAPVGRFDLLDAYSAMIAQAGAIAGAAS